MSLPATPLLTRASGVAIGAGASRRSRNRCDYPWIAVLPLVLMGCAPALPVLGRTHTAARGRADMGIGAAGRVPLGDLRASRQASPSARTLAGGAAVGGVVPVASADIGVASNLNVRLAAIGTTFTADIRGMVDWGSLDGGFRLLWGAGALFGWSRWEESSDSQADGPRLGAQLPLLVAYELAGIAGIWAGLRLASEIVWLSLDSDTQHSRERLWGTRGGLVLGMSLGFRRVHGFVECTTDYERWALSGGRTIKGFALTPAFGMRVLW